MACAGHLWAAVLVDAEYHFLSALKELELAGGETFHAVERALLATSDGDADHTTPAGGAEPEPIDSVSCVVVGQGAIRHRP